MGFLKKFPMSRKRFIGLMALMGAYTMIESNFRPNKSGSNGNPGLADDRPFGAEMLFDMATTLGVGLSLMGEGKAAWLMLLPFALSAVMPGMGAIWEKPWENQPTVDPMVHWGMELPGYLALHLLAYLEFKKHWWPRFSKLMPGGGKAASAMKTAMKSMKKSMKAMKSMKKRK